MSDKPPTRTRRGRPPGSRNEATILRELAAQKVTIRDADGTRTVTYMQANTLRLLHKAARGDLRVDKRLDLIRARLQPEQTEVAGVLLVPGMMEEAEWVRQAEIRNRFAERPEMDPPPRPAEPPETSPPLGSARFGMRRSGPDISSRSSPRLFR